MSFSHDENKLNRTAEPFFGKEPQSDLEVKIQTDFETEREAEIAAEMGEKEDAVTAALEAIVEPVSLYDPVYSDGADSVFVMDGIRDEENTDEHWIESIALENALAGLGKRESAIINMRFFRGKTQMEIAEEIGISQAQVSRIEKSALERMRKAIN